MTRTALIPDDASDWAALLERLERLERTVAQAPHAVAFGGVGGYSTGGPPNGTSGNQFKLPAAGRYAILTSASAWRTVVGQGGFRVWINGVLVSTTPFYFNTINAHTFMGIGVGHILLPAGNNYHWIAMGASDPTNMASDSADTFSCLVIPSPVVP